MENLIAIIGGIVVLSLSVFIMANVLRRGHIHRLDTRAKLFSLIFGICKSLLIGTVAFNFLFMHFFPGKVPIIAAINCTLFLLLVTLIIYVTKEIFFPSISHKTAVRDRSE